MSSRRAQQAREVTESYLGALSVGLVLALLWLLQGCSSGVPKHASCDEAKVAAFTARCAAQVKLLCDPNPDLLCDTELLCDAELCELCPLADGCEK